MSYRCSYLFTSLLQTHSTKATLRRPFSANATNFNFSSHIMATVRSLSMNLLNCANETTTISFKNRHFLIQWYSNTIKFNQLWFIFWAMKFLYFFFFLRYYSLSQNPILELEKNYIWIFENLISEVKRYKIFVCYQVLFMVLFIQIFCW